ncbi:response regulator [Ruminococcaceae bacterium OttesenSCG-928-D13]|nr:response regulator [Ruminococcaceae bacterium OttesenSCG-928-D13]
MNIIAVDDERLALKTLEKTVAQVMPGTNVYTFLSPFEAWAFARDNQVDIAFLDIQMGEMNGLVLAKHLKEEYSKTNIIFVTGYAQYKSDAMDLRASGYLKKPVQPKRVLEEIENLRNPVQLPDTGIRIQCFGNFEIFVEGKPVPFRRSKSKEILAYLVDRRGAAVSRKELAAVLWEDEPYSRTLQSYLTVLLAELKNALQAVGAQDLIVAQRGSYAVNLARIGYCDAYQFTEWDHRAVNAYYGEYMSNYSWGEASMARFWKDKM